MDGKEYGELAQVTEPKDWSLVKGRVDDKMVRLLHSALGLSSELSEIREAISLAERENLIDYINLAEEAGDLSWYTAIALSALELHPNHFWPGNSENKFFAPLSTITNTVDNLVVFVGEFNNQLKRALFYGKAFDQNTLEDALSGICDEIRNLACHVGSDLSTVQERNIAKLKARYGEKFSEYAALNRDLKTEREVLEGK